MAETVLRALPEYEAALATHVRLLLFKHSPLCPISAAAHAEYRRFCAQHPDVPTLFVDVVVERALSRAIADRCGVKHESPQAILLQQGVAVWHASHAAITQQALAAAWAPSC